MPLEKVNAVVGQSGGPTSAINATLAGVIKGCLEENCIDKVYGMRNGIEGFLEEKLTDLEPYFTDRDALELLSLTPSSALGSCRLKLKSDEQFEKVFKVIEKYNIK